MEIAAQRNLYAAFFLLGISPFLVNGAINPVIAPYPWIFWGFEVLSWVVLPLTIFGIALRRLGLRAEEIGLHARIRGRRNLGLVLVLCVLFAPLYLIVYNESRAAFLSIFPGAPLFAYQSIVPESGAMRVVAILYLAITAGVVEELYFRGLFFKISGFFPAQAAVYVLSSATFFSLIHWEGALFNVAATFVLGLITALLYLLIRNLWPFIIGHAYTDYVWMQMT